MQPVRDEMMSAKSVPPIPKEIHTDENEWQIVKQKEREEPYTAVAAAATAPGAEGPDVAQAPSLHTNHRVREDAAIGQGIQQDAHHGQFQQQESGSEQGESLQRPSKGIQAETPGAAAAQRKTPRATTTNISGYPPPGSRPNHNARPQATLFRFLE